MRRRKRKIPLKAFDQNKPKDKVVGAIYSIMVQNYLKMKTKKSSNTNR